VKALRTRLAKIEAAIHNRDEELPIRFARYLRSQGRTPECFAQPGEQVIIFEILDDLEPGERLI